MIAGLLQALSPEAILAASISLASVFFAGIPFYRGLCVFLSGRAATRRVDPCARQWKGSIQPLAQRMMGVLARTLRDQPEQPADFVMDASRQYVLNEYEVAYARPLSMYANILPPIGFIGTVVGMMALFVSLHLSSQTLQIGALSVALSSTIVALLGFATLETLRIRLYGRLMRCMNDALGADPEAWEEAA